MSNNTTTPTELNSDVLTHLGDRQSGARNAEGFQLEGQHHLDKLKQFDYTLTDWSVSWPDVEAIRDNENYFFRWKGKKDFYATRSAIGQVLGSRAGGQVNLSTWDKMPHDYKFQDLDIPLRQVILQETFDSRTDKFKRKFREVDGSFLDDVPYGTDKDGKVVVGIVGSEYPVNFSDYRQVAAVNDVLNDLGIQHKYGHSHIRENGNIDFSWYFNNKELIDDNVDNPLRQGRGGITSGNIARPGLSYRNNFAGRGSLGFSTYRYQQVCSNGMMGYGKNAIVYGVRHQTADSFVRNLIDNVFKFPEDMVKDFRGHTGLDFELPEPLPASYYIDGDNITKMYEHIAKAIVFRTLFESQTLKEKYRKASNLVLADWRHELLEIQHRFDISNDLFKKLQTVALNDPTIKLNLDTKEAEYSALPDIFTSTANFLFSAGSNNKAIEFQQIGGKLLSDLKPITPLLTVSQS